MVAWLRVTYVLAKRELLAYLLSPVTYILAALFLLSQGYSFWLLLDSLSTRQASISTLFSSLFGGTFLYWFFLLFLIAVLTMRLFSAAGDGADRRSPRDLLLSTGVPEGAIVLGKHLGASLLYCLLWAPTGLQLHFLSRYGGGAGTVALGSACGGYLGVFLTGQSALAFGLLCSVLAPTQLVAAALCFVGLSLLLLSGLVADAYSVEPWLHGLLSYSNQFRHMDELARGIVDSRRLLYHGTVTLLCLSLSTALLRVRPGNASGRLRVLVFSVAAIASFFGVNWLGSQHPWRGDLSRHREHALSAALLATLRQLPQPVALTVLAGDSDGLGRDELDVRLRETLLRAEQAAPERLRVSYLDLDRQRERVRLLAERYHLDRDELRLGLLLLQSGVGDQERTVSIPRDRLADFVRDEAATAATTGAEPQLVRYHGEAALQQALLAVTNERTPSLCFTRGHGESEHDSLTGSGGGELSLALARENFATRALANLADPGELAATGSRACDVVIISGPERPFLPAEVDALARYLDGGGRLLLLSGALLDRELSRFLDTGLEALLQSRGLRLGQAVVFDPPSRLGDSLAFVVESGYAPHAITRPLLGRRTLWPLVRPIYAESAQLPGWRAQTLISTGDGGQAVADLELLRAARAGASPGPGQVPATPAGVQPIAAVAEAAPAPAAAMGRSARIAALGSAQLAWNDTLVLYNRDLLISAIRWLADLPTTSSIAPKQPGQVRLVLTAAQTGRLFVLLVLGLPLLALLLGLGVRWIRQAP